MAALAAFLTPIMSSSVTIALPSIGGEFSMGAAALGWVATAYLLAAAVFLVPFGRIADIHGRRRMFLSGLSVFTAASLLCALAPGPGWLVAMRIVQGTGGAMIFSTSMAILTSVFPPQRRGRVLGISVSSTYAGLSLGPFLGGLLTRHLGWRSIFIAPVPLGLAAVLLAARGLKGEWAEAKGERLDVIGSAVFGLSLAALVYGLSRLPASAGVALSLGGVAGLALFVFRQARIANPVLDVKLFTARPIFGFSALAALIHYSATFAVAFLMSLYLQTARGLDPQAAGLALIAQPVMMAAFSPITGRLSDRIEPRVLASAGMGIMAVGLLLLSFMDLETPLAYPVAAMAALGFGYALFSSPNTNAIMGAVERRQYGVAAATVGAMRLIGQMLSMAAAAAILAAYVGRTQLAAADPALLVAGTRTGFLVFTVVCVGGIAASLARGRLHPSPPSP